MTPVALRPHRRRPADGGLDRLRRFLAADEGVAALEFALTIPMLLAVVFGLIGFSQAFSAVQNVNAICSSVADLTAQVQSTTPAAIADEFQVAGYMLGSQPVANLSIRITSALPVMTNGQVTGAVVGWCQASGAALACPAKGAPLASLQNGYHLPLGMMTTSSSSIIVTEVSYAFVSPVSTVLPNGLNLYNVSFLSPRLSAQVTCAAC